MKTYEATVTNTEWTEILGGETSLYIDIAGPDPILLNFEEDGPPALDAPATTIQPGKDGWDFQASGLKLNQRIYARTKLKPIQIVVVR